MLVETQLAFYGLPYVVEDVVDLFRSAEAEIAERRDERSEPPAEPAVETPPRPTKRKADAAAEKLAQSVKAKVAEPAPEKEARSAKAKTEEPAAAKPAVSPKRKPGAK